MRKLKKSQLRKATKESLFADRKTPAARAHSSTSKVIVAQMPLDVAGTKAARTHSNSRARTQRTDHGGELSLGKRKEARPFDRRQALHVVLRSSQARGASSMLHPKHCNRIKHLLEKVKSHYKIRVYRYANVGNHLHLLIKAPSRAAWQAFIRHFSGGLAMLVTGAKKCRALPRANSNQSPPRANSNQSLPRANSNQSLPRANKSTTIATAETLRGFWDHLVYTRLVSWGRDFNGVATYVLKNLWEGAGIEFRKFLKHGYQVMEISEDGFVLVAPLSPGLGRD
jgi:REP element-mobilizing transposase RayT